MKIILATPISGFENEGEYLTYRKQVISLIDRLAKHYTVYAEIEVVKDAKFYDSPDQSVSKDFKAIEEADCFILLHPYRMQTSSFIELGYAYAQKKPILIVSREENLPYMALGLSNADCPAIIVSPDEENVQIHIEEILSHWEKIYCE